MNNLYIFAALITGAVCTFLLRSLPFLVFNGSRTMPAWLQRLNGALPAALMAVLVVYCLKDVAGNFLGSGLYQLGGVAVTAASYKWRHSLFLSMLLGTAAYMILLRIFVL